MAKKEVSEEIKTLRTAIKQNTAIIGTDRVLKQLKLSKLKVVYVASNTPQETLNDIKHYAHLSDANVLALMQDNEELGVLCKKNFFVSVVGLA